MRAPSALACLFALTFAVTACGDNSPVEPTPRPVTPTPASESPAASPSPVSPSPEGPGWAYPEATTTDIGPIDALLTAWRAGEPLLPLAGPGEAPCVAAPPPGILRPPVCPEGVEEGSLVPAYFVSNCPEHWEPIDPTSTTRIESFDAQVAPYLYAIARFPIAEYGIEYIVTWSTGERFVSAALTDEGLAGIGGGGACGASDIDPYLDRVQEWILPPLAQPPLP